MIVAHALGGIRDLPVPGELFLYGGAAVLGLSFIALGALWHQPQLEEAAEGRPLPERAQQILLSRALRIALGAFGTFAYVAVVIAAFAGIDSIDQNLAPTVVWVLFWLGFVWVSIFFGNVWAVLSPFRAVADAVAWRTRGLPPWQPFAYPARLGRWPAALLLFAFTAMELVYPTPAEPRSLGGAIVIYSTITWCGMLLFGRRAWLENGEAFNVYFGLFGRIAPFAVREEDGRREVVVRPFLSGLSTFRAGAGSLAFVAVMLGSVAFDSITRTSAWQNFQASHLTTQPTRALVQLGFLACVVLFVACAYLAAVRLARLGDELEPGEDPSLAPYFLSSLVPIALVYSLAHYVSLVLIQGQYIFRLVSDPLGKGWDLLGTASYSPNLTVISPNQTWYVQVGVLVTGHVLGLVLAHDRAVSLYEGRAALRSQYAMLMLMVLYTVGGLYLLSRP
jgi:hypothetical protein